MGRKERANILLVDDQPSRLLTYEAILGDLGENLVQARSGTEALERLMEREFAVILLDVSMPGMDGFETASLIHEHPRFEQTPIIFVTGVNVTDPDRLKGYALGAVDYVYIPVVPEILRNKVAVLVELYSKRRELQELNRILEHANLELSRANSTLQADKARDLECMNANLEEANAKLETANRALQAEVAERTRVEEVLKETDRRKDEFLAMLAHELRNPLAPVRNALEIMLRLPPADPRMAWSRDVIERQIIHLTRLVNDLLDVSRITLGKFDLRKAPVDLATVIEAALETSRPAIDERGHKLTVQLPDEPCIVNGDAVRLAQVVSNLLDNSAKYTEIGGQIWLTLERAQSTDAGPCTLQIRVKDTGIGISAAALPSIFDTFVQAAQKPGHAREGLGIGLALVRKLVEMHGGSASAHSEGEGRGSELTVRLPEFRPEAIPAAGFARSARPKTKTPRRILVVDDNADAAKSLALLLDITGDEVRFAENGLEAVEKAESFRPDVILLDIGMPLLDGYETARRIRGQPWGKDIIMVALTGYNQEVDRTRTHDAGIDAHVTKPADVDSLLSLMERLIATRDAGRAKNLQRGAAPTP